MREEARGGGQRRCRFRRAKVAPVALTSTLAASPQIKSNHSLPIIGHRIHACVSSLNRAYKTEIPATRPRDETYSA